MSENRNTSRIIWAVDAVSGDLTFQKRMATFLTKFTKNRKSEIEPVCVVSPPNPYLESGWVTEFLRHAEDSVYDRLVKWSQKLKLPGLLPPVILTQDSYSTRKAVQSLVNFAKDARADLIAVSSHARKGISRMFMGSFAESLVLHSDIPVLVVNPSMNVPRGCKHILLATDFTEKSFVAYLEALELARLLDAKVTVYNKVELITDFTLPTLSVGPPYQDYLQKDILRRKQAAKRFELAAQEVKVSVKTVIDERPGDVEKAILRRVKSDKVDLVAMASESGPLSAVILGSIARQILRKSPCPVWLIHPKTKAEARHKPVSTVPRQHSKVML